MLNRGNNIDSCRLSPTPKSGHSVPIPYIFNEAPLRGTVDFESLVHSATADAPVAMFDVHQIRSRVKRTDLGL